jgi:hypothetical protein
MQKSFRSCDFVGLWFGNNLTEVEIELSMCSIGRRAVLWFVGWWYGLNMRHMQKSFKSRGFVGLWFEPNLAKVEI